VVNTPTPAIPHFQARLYIPGALGENISSIMMFDLLFRTTIEPKPDSIQVGSRSVPLLFVYQPRARRYLLRLRADGIARITVPRRGSISTAREFLARNISWLERQFYRLENQPKTTNEWKPGTEILFRGELMKIELEATGQLRFGSELLTLRDATVVLRPAIQKHLRKLAAKELPARVMELATLHGIEVSRISVRNQKSRWGSCSRKGTISLNWRLIQTPDYVRDYIILHELAHRRQMNHSDAFWLEVHRLCPDYLRAERWLKTNRSLFG
jgi:predicted metal-dependent hydrolase